MESNLASLYRELLDDPARTSAPDEIEELNRDFADFCERRDRLNDREWEEADG